MDIVIKSFTDLSTQELYEILKIRSEVFVVEQNCVYLDLDSKDQQSIHIYGKKDDKIIAYLRVIPYELSLAIGRVLVHKDYRSNSHSRELLLRAIDYVFKNFHYDEIYMEAQVYLKDFYESLGFIRISEDFILDGIPHLEMLLKKS